MCCLSISVTYVSVFTLSDPYVKIWMCHEGKKMEKKKTSIKEKCLNPVFNESFIFNVPYENIRKTSLNISVMDYDRMGRNELIGQVLLGSKSGPMEVKHWNEMFAKSRQPVAQWHILKDFSWSHLPRCPAPSPEYQPPIMLSHRSLPRQSFHKSLLRILAPLLLEIKGGGCPGSVLAASLYHAIGHFVSGCAEMHWNSTLGSSAILLWNIAILTYFVVILCSVCEFVAHSVSVVQSESSSHRGTNPLLQ